MAEATLELFDIVYPDPEFIRPEVWENVFRLLQESKWFEKDGQRIGFVDTARDGEVIAGYFANEGQKRSTQYSDDKERIEQTFPSFEHLFFAIFADTPQVLLQRRNIYGYDDLGLPIMRDNFLELFATLLQMSGVIVSRGRVRIEPAGAFYTQEEMYAFFRNNPVISLQVSRLDAELIPGPEDPRFVLYNPQREKNEIIWGAMADTIRAGARKAEIDSENVTDAHLNTTPIARALPASGELSQVSARIEDRVIIRNKVGEEEVIVDLPATPTVVSAVIESIRHKLDPNLRRQSWTNRMENRKREQPRGPLFNPDEPQ